MNDLERRGRVLVFAIAGILIVHGLLGLLILLLAPDRLAGSWLSVAVPFFLAGVMFAGRGGWAPYISVVLALNALGFFVGLIASGNPVAFVVLLPVASIYGIAAVALWRSKAIEAFFEMRGRGRDSMLSLGALRNEPDGSATGSDEVSGPRP